jgi:non-specific serine/threonine protein kinase
LTPHGRLILEPQADAPSVDEAAATRLHAAFTQGSGHGLLRLGAAEIGQALPPSFIWWRNFAGQFVTALCQHAPDAPTAPDAAERARLCLAAPLMPGGEYLNEAVLLSLWQAIAAAFDAARATSGGTVQDVLTGLNPAWNLVGRVHFNLAENRRDGDQPFAFMATYTTRLSAQARPQHVPLGQALRDFAGAANREKLLSLLLPVQRAAERCAWLKRLVDRGDIFHPMRWGPPEAWQFLQDATELEQAGVVLRLPAQWRANRPPRPQVTATVGGEQPAKLGLDALMSFRMAVALEGDPLTAKEVAGLLSGTENLVLLRGRWVEVDRAKLASTMARFEAAEARASAEGLSFAEAMRLLTGAAVAGGDDDTAREAGWAEVSAGPWLAQTLAAMRAPDAAGADPGPALRGTLRPYQKQGVQWLRLLTGLGLGACLADDMGLGKTIQLLSLLLIDQARGAQPRPSLLVAPASLLGNWAAEIERFAPGLHAMILHPSALPAAAIKAFSAEQAAAHDLVITSYATLLRGDVLASIDWRYVILDEAQAIKNPGARQTKAVKALRAQARIALTGTPVENHLGDLWSIFDFINPGLLGNARQFNAYAKNLGQRAQNPYGPLRELVRPYILRRMKTDRSIIADLPDKTEIKALCGLSRKQTALYGQAVEELAKNLESADGMKRRGLVLAMLTRLKQICNHPSHWLADGGWAEEDSGKWARLREIAETVAARQEKMLIFTQFREITAPLAAFLSPIFGANGLVLHGDTKVADRKTLVQRFQEDEDVPFFVLSLKAGGSGLTLTAASHVVHFDRWWNPAVENQATDRAFRIGQKKSVLVHKFICRGTLEEKVDALIDSKRAVSDELLAGSGEVNLTELGNDDILRLVRLDLATAIKE